MKEFEKTKGFKFNKQMQVAIELATSLDDFVLVGDAAMELAMYELYQHGTDRPVGLSTGISVVTPLIGDTSKLKKQITDVLEPYGWNVNVNTLKNATKGKCWVQVILTDKEALDNVDTGSQSIAVTFQCFLPGVVWTDQVKVSEIKTSTLNSDEPQTLLAVPRVTDESLIANYLIRVSAGNAERNIDDLFEIGELFLNRSYVMGAIKHEMKGFSPDLGWILLDSTEKKIKAVWKKHHTAAGVPEFHGDKKATWFGELQKYIHAFVYDLTADAVSIPRIILPGSEEEKLIEKLGANRGVNDVWALVVKTDVSREDKAQEAKAEAEEEAKKAERVKKIETAESRGKAVRVYKSSGKTLSKTKKEKK